MRKILPTSGNLLAPSRRTSPLSGYYKNVARRKIFKLLSSNPKDLFEKLTEHGWEDREDDTEGVTHAPMLVLFDEQDVELLNQVSDAVEAQQRENRSRPGVKELFSRSINFDDGNYSADFLRAILGKLQEISQLELRKFILEFGPNLFNAACIQLDSELMKIILEELSIEDQREIVAKKLSFYYESLEAIDDNNRHDIIAEWIDIAERLGCLDEVMSNNILLLREFAFTRQKELAKREEDSRGQPSLPARRPSLLEKLIPLFEGKPQQQNAVCLALVQNLEDFRKIWEKIPPTQHAEVIAKRYKIYNKNYQLFNTIAYTTNYELIKEFLKILQKSGQIDEAFSIDDPADARDSSIYQTLYETIINNGSKSFRLLFSQLNPEQKRALVRKERVFNDLLHGAVTQPEPNADIISDLFRWMSPIEKIQALRRYDQLYQAIEKTGNFGLFSRVLNAFDLIEALEQRLGRVFFANNFGDRFLGNNEFVTFANCHLTLQLPAPQDREYAKGAPLDFAREIMRRTIVAITNAIIPDNDEDSALTDEAKALRKYQAHAAEAGHATSLIGCATRKMGALVMDNLQQFREARDISIALEQAFRNPSDAFPTNQDVGRLIAEAAMPHLEKIVPADVMQLADFDPTVMASPPEAIAADIAKANEVMQKIYHGIKSEIFTASEKEPASSVASAAAAAAAAALTQNPSNTISHS